MNGVVSSAPPTPGTWLPMADRALVRSVAEKLVLGPDMPLRFEAKICDGTADWPPELLMLSWTVQNSGSSIVCVALRPFLSPRRAMSAFCDELMLSSLRLPRAELRSEVVMPLRNFAFAAFHLSLPACVTLNCMFAPDCRLPMNALRLFTRVSAPTTLSSSDQNVHGDSSSFMLKP